MTPCNRVEDSSFQRNTVLTYQTPRFHNPEDRDT